MSSQNHGPYQVPASFHGFEAPGNHHLQYVGRFYVPLEQLEVPLQDCSSMMVGHGAFNRTDLNYFWPVQVPVEHVPYHDEWLQYPGLSLPVFSLEALGAANRTAEELHPANSLHDLSKVAPPRESSEDRHVPKSKLESMKEFACAFRSKRIQLGLSQEDVCLELLNQEIRISQATISRFEGLHLSFSNLLRIRLVLEKWMQSLSNGERGQAANTDGQLPERPKTKERRSRTMFDDSTKAALEEQFQQNPFSKREVWEKLAKSTGVPIDVVECWFNNRRAKWRTEKEKIKQQKKNVSANFNNKVLD